jgi:hypothetical protein
MGAAAAQEHGGQPPPGGLTSCTTPPLCPQGTTLPAFCLCTGAHAELVNALPAQELLSEGAAAQAAGRTACEREDEALASVASVLRRLLPSSSSDWPAHGGERHTAARGASGGPPGLGPRSASLAVLLPHSHAPKCPFATASSTALACSQPPSQHPPYRLPPPSAPTPHHDLRGAGHGELQHNITYVL